MLPEAARLRLPLVTSVPISGDLNLTDLIKKYLRKTIIFPLEENHICTYNLLLLVTLAVCRVKNIMTINDKSRTKIVLCEEGGFIFRPPVHLTMILCLYLFYQNIRLYYLKSSFFMLIIKFFFAGGGGIHISLKE